MQKKQRRRHDAQVRVNGVCAQHSELFDATPGGQSTRTSLGTCVADVSRLLAVQKQSTEDRRAATEQCRVARGALRAGAKAVVRIGDLVRLDQTTMETLQIPRPMSDDELIAYSQGLLNRVSPYADAFVAKGLPPDLLKQLGVSIQALVTARDARATAVQQYAAATASIRETQDLGDKTVAALEAVAINMPAANPEVVTKLKMAKRVGPRVDHHADASPAPTPAPNPAPVTAPAPSSPAPASTPVAPPA